MTRSRILLLLLLLSPAANADKPWKDSPHGPMLERIIPPGFEPAMLPEPRWPAVVRRMVPRMEGQGNMGKLMTEMMAGVEAPSLEDEQAIVAYHRKHALRPLDAKRIPEVNSSGAESFRVACGQCHALPDPRMHTGKEWPAVVARMQRNMEWMNRVVGSKPLAGEPRLKIEDINAFLVRHARR